jgi:hypothetical protein
MHPIDPAPSTDALAIANSAMILAIFDALIAKGIFEFADVSNVIRTAIASVSTRTQSVEGAEALKFLQSLLRDFSKN